MKQINYEKKWFQMSNVGDKKSDRSLGSLLGNKHIQIKQKHLKSKRVKL